MNRLAIVSLLGLPVAGAIATVPAGASTGTHIRLVARDAGPLSVAKDKIKGEGKTATFNPTALTTPEYTEATCVPNGTDVSFKLKNKGTATAYVTFEGSPAFTLPAASTEDICFYGGAAGDTASLGLSNAANTKTYASTLTITLSD
jgi:hypothetical protein